MKIRYFLMIMAFGGLLIPSFNYENVEAAHSAKDTLTYQTVYVTHNKTCYNFDLQRMSEYNEIVTRYISAYNLEHFYYNPTCLSWPEYLEFITQPYTDLIFVIYSKDLGRTALHDRNFGGFFTWIGERAKQPLLIVACDCPSFNYGHPSWVISHELAHFALYYLDYSSEVYADWVHYNQNIYYLYCEDGNYTHAKCKPIFAKIFTYNTDYNVMAIYEDAKNKTPPKIKYSTAQGSPVPTLDGDGDGIADRVDSCPLAAETVNGYKDDDGCPDTAQAQLAFQVDPKVTLSLFAANKDRGNSFSATEGDSIQLTGKLFDDKGQVVRNAKIHLSGAADSEFSEDIVTDVSGNFMYNWQVPHNAKNFDGENSKWELYVITEINGQKIESKIATVDVLTPKTLIPDWVKNNAKWWALGHIAEADFLRGVQYLMNEEIIVISDLPKAGSEKADSIPDWVKNNAEWWANDLISQDDFVNGLKYLIETGVIQVN